MAKCAVCGTRMTFTESNIALSFGGRCKECLSVNQEELDKTNQAIMLTTETAPNLNIVSRVGIIMAEVDCVFTVEMVKHNHALQSKLRSEAYSIEANAVVGITFNMIETYSATLGVSKVNTFKLIASGTAVVVEEMNDG